MKKFSKMFSVAMVMAFGLASMTFALPTFATTGLGGGSAASNSKSQSNATQQSKDGMDSVNPGATNDLEGSIRNILNTVFFVAGIISVIVIIIGGVNYSLSQGDPQKVKKAKDTIMYGIIGLVVSLLAFAIVEFVLSAL